MNDKVETPLILSAIKGLCPVCSAQTLFVGPVKFNSRCSGCGLDYDQFNVGDGPAAFLTMVVGGLVLGFALFVEAKFHPSIWVHLLIWPPVTVAAVMGFLRMAKGALLILEYRNKAHEGKLVVTDKPTDRDA